MRARSRSGRRWSVPQASSYTCGKKIVSLKDADPFDEGSGGGTKLLRRTAVPFVVGGCIPGMLEDALLSPQETET